MVLLTERDRMVIAKNPFDDSLKLIRKALRDAGLEGSNTPEQSDLFLPGINLFWAMLIFSKATTSLSLLTGRNSLHSDLESIRSRLGNKELDSSSFHSLVKAIINEEPDAEIWVAVFNIIEVIPTVTRKYEPLSKNTPPFYSSAVLENSESLLTIEHHIFEEISCVTYRGVDGFFDKYFENKGWKQRAEATWDAARARYNNNTKKWTGFPDVPTKDSVCEWWFGLQQELLANERAAYFRSTLKNKVKDDKAKRQIDLLVKKKRDEESDANHDWQDVLIIGELKKSNYADKALVLQISSGVRNVFASQPTRLFVPAFSLVGAQMETWVFDRSGPYSGVSFNIHEEPEKFIRVMCGYLMMSDEEFGLNAFVEERDNKLSITLSNRGLEQQLELKRDPIFLQRAIVTRGTCCFMAKPSDTAEYDRVVKFSWTPSVRPPEADLLIKANDRGVKGLAKLVGYNEEVASTSKLREGLVFSTRHPFQGIPRSTTTSSPSQQLRPSHSGGLNGRGKRRATDSMSPPSKRMQKRDSLPVETAHRDKTNSPTQESQGTSRVQQDQKLPFENRILRVLAVSPPGRPISQYMGVIELLEGLHDAIKVHRSLLEDGKILHRDISESNIILTDPDTANGFKGMLIDLDLAKEEGTGLSGAQHRTGTIQFMAIDVLLDISLHTYRHDLESFFYVLIWQCTRRAWKLTRQPPPNPSRLSLWYTGNFKQIALAKYGDMMFDDDSKGFDGILKEFPETFDCLKDLCRTIRNILFPYTPNQAARTSTPLDPKVLYDPIIDALEDTLKELTM